MSIGLLAIQLMIFSILVGGPLVAFVLYRRMKARQDRLSWEANQSYTLFEVLVPKNNDRSPLAAEQMFASLHGVFREQERHQYQLTFEIASHGQFIHFYAYVPTHLKDFVEGQMYAQYPSIEIKEIDDYTRHDFTGHLVVGTELGLTKADVYPIKTFQSFDVDPMSAITAVLGKVSSDEQAWIQIIVRPVADDWQLKGIGFASAKRAGESGESRPWWKRFIRSLVEFGLDLFRTAVGSVEPVESGGVVKKLSAPEEAAVKGIETKVTKLGFESEIRIVTVASDEVTARSRIDGLTGAFKQFNTTNLNGFRASGVSVGESILDHYRQRRFIGDGSVLNIEELASLYHFPAESVETPNIVWAGSKKGEPPANLPFEGQVPPEELTVFSETDFRTLRRRFGLKRGDRRLHMYAIGKTGTGKSTLLENMIIDDIQKGKGVAVVDPHGDLVDHVLNFVPEHRINDVIYFNPADREFPVAFNLLESLDPDLKSIAASGLMSIFTKLWANVWSARMEYILRNTVLALLEYPEATFLEIMKLLVDPRFRKRVLAYVKDPVIRDFFINEFERYDPKFRTEAIAPIQNKVGQFLSSATIRNIVGQPKSSFNLREAMDSRKILLLDLSVGKIGEDNAALLGAMMITKIQLAAMTRVDLPEPDRTDFYLYVDEFQNFASESFAVILSEARKYHLNLILTNQYIAQMPELVAKAIFGNIGTLVSFRVGSNDASVLARELEPVFDANDLVNLDNYHVYLKMSIDGVTRPAFSAKTLPPFSGKNENRERIIDVSRGKYASARADVEAAIESQGLKHSGLDGQDAGQLREAGLGSPVGGVGEPTESVQSEGPKYRRLGKSRDGIVWYGTDDVGEDGGQQIRESNHGAADGVVGQVVATVSTELTPVLPTVEPAGQPPTQVSAANRSAGALNHSGDRSTQSLPRRRLLQIPDREQLAAPDHLLSLDDVGAGDSPSVVAVTPAQVDVDELLPIDETSNN
jgi:hypothetical protein